jgi:uncharacterized protein YrrD
MLQSINDLVGYRIAAADGEIGSITDALFEEASSSVRYFVIETGSWLSGREVLLSPAAFGDADPAARLLPTALTKAQIESSPEVSTQQPLSRDLEEEMFRHYDWTPYWGMGLPFGGMAWSGMPLAATPDPEIDSGIAAELRAREYDEVEQGNRLRSAKEVIGYYVKAADGDIGHIDDMLMDEAGRVIRYLVIDTRNWLPGRKVLVAIHWFKSVDWFEQTVTTDMARAEIEASPPYDPSRPLDREQERRLFEHYHRDPYWS